MGTPGCSSPGEPDGVAQAVGERGLPLVRRLQRQLGEQQAEGVGQRQQEASHQRLLPLCRTLGVHDQHAGRLEHEQLVVAGQQRREAVVLGRRGRSQRCRGQRSRPRSERRRVGTHGRSQFQQVLDPGQDVLDEGRHVFTVETQQTLMSTCSPAPKAPPALWPVTL